MILFDTLTYFTLKHLLELRKEWSKVCWASECDLSPCSLIGVKHSLDTLNLRFCKISCQRKAEVRLPD